MNNSENRFKNKNRIYYGRNLQQTQIIDAGKLHSPGRILSIDALRGFDMLWILGASELAIALLTLKKTNWTLRLAAEFDHVSWNGFAFYDLIFPLISFYCRSGYSFLSGKVSPGKSPHQF